jgi:hypothetical protein
MSWQMPIGSARSLYPASSLLAKIGIHPSQSLVSAATERLRAISRVHGHRRRTPTTHWYPKPLPLPLIDLAARGVQRLMRMMSFQAIWPVQNTSKTHPEHKLSPYLLRNVPITRVDHV